MFIRRYGRFAFRGTVVLSAGSAALLSAADFVGSDAGAVRSFRFWRGMLPVYSHYKFAEWLVKDETDPSIVSAKYSPLHKRYAPRVKELALNLKGFYFKLAQLLSTRDDFLPDEYLEWTKALQNKSPSVMPSDEAQAIVERSLNVKVDDLFSEWDDEPIGAASIAQVHRARLRENGKLVAVKIQYPGIEKKFRNDIATVEMFCKWLMPQNSPYFNEIKKQFATEFDARGEAENLQLVHDNIHRAGWQRLVEVPEPIYSSKEVLVMTYLPGPKLEDGVREGLRKMAERQGKDFEEIEREQKRLIESDKLERKDVAASAAETRRIATLLWLRDSVVNGLISVGNWTVRPLFSNKKWEYVESEAPINLGQILDTLLRVHAHEIFQDGSFNSDGHGGNIILMPDGRLGLVDYGQVKHMGLEERIVYAKLILAISRDDREEVVRLMTDEVGFRTTRMDPNIIFLTAAFFNCRDSDDITQGMNVSKFMEWLEKSDPVVNINDEYVMVGRVSVLMRGMANAFGMKLRVSDYWKKEAEQFLKSRGISY